MLLLSIFCINNFVHNCFQYRVESIFVCYYTPRERNAIQTTYTLSVQALHTCICFINIEKKYYINLSVMELCQENFALIFENFWFSSKMHHIWHTSFCITILKWKINKIFLLKLSIRCIFKIKWLIYFSSKKKRSETKVLKGKQNNKYIN